MVCSPSAAALTPSKPPIRSAVGSEAESDTPGAVEDSPASLPVHAFLQTVAVAVAVADAAAGNKFGKQQLAYYFLEVQTPKWEMQSSKISTLSSS